MWNHFSIRIQLVILMTIVITIVELSTLFMVHNIQANDAKNSTILEAETITKSLNQDILKFILNPNADMLADITYRLSAFKKISGFILFNDQKKAIFKYGDITNLQKLEKNILDERVVFTDNNLYVKDEIKVDDYSFGSTLIDMSLAQHNEKQALITSSFLLNFPIVLLLGFLVSFFLSKSYTKPFSVLLDAMKKSDPTENKIIPIQTTAQNEIKDLFDGFNQQMKDIATSSEKINKLNQDIEDTQKEVVFTMGAIGETRSKETGNHVKRVAEYSKTFALLYGLNEKEAEMLKQASPMHDIGKVGIPDSVLNKPGRFDEEERKIMDTHAKLGYDMLKASNKPLLKLAATVAYEHHEKWNGSGYPNGLKAEEISIQGRITALADVFDALGSDRVYKKAWDDERIFKLFKEERGIHFDPKLIDIFFDNLDKFLVIREQFKDH